MVPVLKAVLEQSNLDPSKVEDVCIGNLLQIGSGVNQARMAMFMAGLPYTATVKAVNRQCSSGLEAVMSVAYAIMAHQIDLGIGGGVESMSRGSLA